MYTYHYICVFVYIFSHIPATDKYQHYFEVYLRHLMLCLIWKMGPRYRQLLPAPTILPVLQEWLSSSVLSFGHALGKSTLSSRQAVKGTQHRHYDNQDSRYEPKKYTLQPQLYPASNWKIVGHISGPHFMADA